MVEMGVGQEDMIDARQIRYRQDRDPGAGIDQDIVVDEQRRGPQVLAADAAATAEDSQFHRHLIAKAVTLFRHRAANCPAGAGVFREHGSLSGPR